MMKRNIYVVKLHRLLSINNKIPSWMPVNKDLVQNYRTNFDFSSKNVRTRISAKLHQNWEESKGYIKKFDSLNNFKKEAAVLVPVCTTLIRSDIGEPSILFTVRNSKLRTHAGEVSFPGGLYDDVLDSDGQAQRNLTKTAVRETIEEIPSLKMADLEILGRLPPVPDKTRTIKVSPFVAYVGTFSGSSETCVSQIEWNKDEVEDVFVMCIKDFLDERRVGLQTFNERFADIPYWIGPTAHLKDTQNIKEINFVKNTITGDRSFRIWGLSAFVLSQFISKVLIKM